MNDIEKGWLAGIIDGEGSIILERTSTPPDHWRHPIIAVGSTDHEILLKCKEITNGGSISKKKAYNQNKAAWFWRIGGGNKVIEILREIEPYLICPQKKFRAKHLIQNYRINTSLGGKYNENQKVLKREFEKLFYTL